MFLEVLIGGGKLQKLRLNGNGDVCTLKWPRMSGLTILGPIRFVNMNWREEETAEHYMRKIARRITQLLNIKTPIPISFY